MLLSGKKALVIGYGDVGKGSVQSLSQEGMIVKVAEIDPICAMQACMDGYEVVSPYIDGINTEAPKASTPHCCGKMDLIVTTTGNVNVCDKFMLAGGESRLGNLQHRPLRQRDRHAVHARQLAMGRSEATGSQDLPQRRREPRRLFDSPYPKAV
jgi:siroheme synthase (precorrin-2 oxidase/ferrochelatase)